MEKNFADKRTHSRLNVYHLVKYRLLSHPEDRPIVTSVRNISGGGICLLTGKPLNLGTVIVVFINFPKVQKPIQSLAKVMWLKKDPKNKNLYNIGIQFVEIEESLRREIVRRIEEVYAKAAAVVKK